MSGDWWSDSDTLIKVISFKYRFTGEVYEEVGLFLDLLVVIPVFFRESIGDYVVEVTFFYQSVLFLKYIGIGITDVEIAEVFVLRQYPGSRIEAGIDDTVYQYLLVSVLSFPRSCIER